MAANATTLPASRPTAGAGRTLAGAPPHAYFLVSAVFHYLKAIKAIGTDDADKVSAQMRKTKINDFMTKDGWIREDGRIMRDMYLEEVKTPEESKYPGDDYILRATIPAEEAFRPLKDGNCPMVTN